MRELTVIGLAPDGKHIVCVHADTGEKFKVPADEKLQAASRGDTARFGQIEIEMESTLRPKEIQARIRAGASVEQVAAAAGMPHAKVERFAYPVLLERSRAADLAQKGHPIRENGPAVQTLDEVVTMAFKARGHDSTPLEWDAWKDEDGYWVAQLQWQAGRSANAAHWRFQPDAHGGTVTPLDDTARDLIDPDFGRPLRGLAPVSVEPASAKQDTESHPTLDELYESVPTDTPSAEQPEQREQREQPKKPAASTGAKKSKRGKPEMPSWEDVLLGVRSSGH